MPLVAVDWRGFGGSARNPGGYWFPDYYADLEDLLDRLSPRTAASIVGHSMGANVAIIYAGVRPSRVRALVNLEGFGLARTESSQAPARLEKWLDELRESARVPDYADAAELARASRGAIRGSRPSGRPGWRNAGAGRCREAACACWPIPRTVA